MRTTAAEDPHIRHATPGRVRIHWPGWSGQGHQALEAQLLRLSGVRNVRASSLTRNILIHFDPQRTNERALLAILTSTRPDLLGRSCGEGPFPAPQRPACRALHPAQFADPNGRPLHSVRWPVALTRRSSATSSLLRGVQEKSRHGSESPTSRFHLESLLGRAVRATVAALGLGLRAVRHLVDWKGTLPVLKTLATVADVLATLPGLPPVRHALHDPLGRNLTALLGCVMEAVAALLAGNPLALALWAAETCFQLTPPFALPLLSAS